MKAPKRETPWSPSDVVFYLDTVANKVSHHRSSVIINHSPSPKHHINAPNVAADAHMLGLARWLPALFFPLPRSIPKGRP